MSYTAPTSASISSARPTSRSASIEVLKAPSLRVTAWRCSGVCSIGMPMARPICCASSITALTKPRTSGSSRMRSAVAQVSAEIGFMVMLPQSLNQMSRWIRSDTVTLKPAGCSSAATVCTRGAAARSMRSAASVLDVPAACPCGAPMMSPSPLTCRTLPGAGATQLRCTTQPITCAVGMWRATVPCGSTECSCKHRRSRSVRRRTTREGRSLPQACRCAGMHSSRLASATASSARP